MCTKYFLIAYYMLCFIAELCLLNQGMHKVGRTRPQGVQKCPRALAKNCNFFCILGSLPMQSACDMALHLEISLAYFLCSSQ